ncbi:MAG: ATP-dependent Clp protease adaptor ClpS [Paludibacteraceae bacterium]|nr:ATP-dependent Clp protease adaptor ClpS [Paludibacteraceae bacterium]
MEQTQIKDKESRETSFGRPKKYKVIFHNDDFTTMEFVVEVLKTVFYKSEEEADAIMMKVHLEGQAVVGTYSYDVATTKAELAKSMARAEGFPLRVSCVQE